MTTVRWSCWGSLMIFLTILMTLPLVQPAQAKSSRVGRVLLVHDSGDLLPSSTADPVLMMRVLLSHFAKEVVVRGSGDFVPKDGENFDGVVILSTLEGVSQIPIPENSGPVVWAGPGIPKELPPGIRVGGGVPFDFDHVVYGERTIFAGKQQQTAIFEAGGGAKVLAEATDLQRSVPLAIHIPERSFWLFAGVPFWEGGELVFADLLHDALGTGWKKRTLFVRLDGIDPFFDASRLNEVTEWLSKQAVPFAVSYSPANWEGGTGKLVTIARNRPLAEALRRLSEQGVPIIMRGFAGNYHRIPYENAAEFWDFENDHPLPGGKEVLRTRMADGLTVSSRLGIHPSGFMAPAYKLPPGLLDIVGDRFDLYVGRLQTSDMTSEASYVPPFMAEIRNMIFLPENLGYVSRYNPQETVSLILGRSLDMTVVRGALGSFAYDPSLGVEMLEIIILEMKKQGYSTEFPPDLPSGVVLANGIAQIDDLSGFERTRRIGIRSAYAILYLGAAVGLLLLMIYLKRSAGRRRDLFS
ncbi:MAG: DUF2334 domain-containing protein [Thermovirgaceae bacterium]|nr:DUF2334 domain-containing protein [Thermovirgaceae bacterium]